MQKKIHVNTLYIIVSLILVYCTPRPTPTSVPQEAIIRIDKYMNELAEEQAFSGSVLIAQGDNILLNAGYGLANIENNEPNIPQTRYHIGSVTKQFTAMAVLILHAQEKTDVNQPVCSHIPDCPDNWKAITIHQLLTHTSGITDSSQIYVEKNKPDIEYELEEIVSWFKYEPLEFEPGEKFSYSSTGYLLLGYLIEEVSGEPYELFLDQQIFEPLGMANTGYASDDAGIAVGYSYNGFEAEYVNPSLAYSAGGMYSTVEDLYQWDRSFYTAELIPSELIDAIFTPYISTSYFPAAPPYEQVSYGYGWFAGERMGHRVAGHGGSYNGFRALIEHYPDDEITIIVLSNLESSDIAVTTFPSEVIFGE
jgi:CubicO group peptidase (beta-lactamase class C family)